MSWEPGAGERRRGRAVEDLVTAELRQLPGKPLPLGVSKTRSGLNFAVFSRHATGVQLVLFASGQHEPVLELPLDPDLNRTGDVWHLEVAGLVSDVRYGWRAERTAQTDGWHRFDPTKVLIDPYTRALSGSRS